MIAFISIFIPPLIMSCLRKKNRKECKNIYEEIVNYIFCVLALNFVMLIIVCYGFDSRENLFLKLNQYNNFAIKYMILSSAFAVTEPFAEKFVKTKISVDVSLKPVKYVKKVPWKSLIWCYAVALFALNFVRIFDNDFWGDEAFTIQLVKNPIAEIISGTAADVHPPLYYFFVRAAYLVFGNEGWLFHLVSLIPCGIIILLAMTVFWKQFGKEFSVILITLACLSGNAVCYNVEVRMYSWGGLFVLLSFYELYCILQKELWHRYLLFVLFSLAAAYVHYYCLITVAFYYIVLLYLALLKRQLSVKKVILSCVYTVAGYLPWVLVLIKSLKRVSSDFWITDVPTMKECVAYLFSDQFHSLAWGGTAFAALLFILYETGIMTVEKDEKGIFLFKLTSARIRLSENLVWVTAGILSIIGTILTGIVISKVVRPVFLTRYLYPVSIVAWVIFGKIFSRLKGKKLYTLLIVIYLLAACWPGYAARYSNERSMDKKLSETLAATAEIMGQNDVILTDNSHIAWTIADYYYPNHTNRLIRLSDFPELDKETNYWLIIGTWNNENDIRGMAELQGYFCETAIKDGYLGGHSVSVYRIRIP